MNTAGLKKTYKETIAPALQKQFGYQREDYSFYWNDPKFY